MQRLIIDIEDRYLNNVIELLNNLKENIIKNIIVEKQETKNNEQVKLFHTLINNSKNKIKVTNKIATLRSTTQEMNGFRCEK